MIDKYSLILLMAILVGAVSAIVAKSRGRDAVAWFLAGTLFNFFALAALAFLKSLKEKRG